MGARPEKQGETVININIGRPRSGDFGGLRKFLETEIKRTVHSCNVVRTNSHVVIYLSNNGSSRALLSVLLRLRHDTPVSFSLMTMGLSRGRPNFPTRILPRCFRTVNIPCHVMRRSACDIIGHIVPRKGAVYKLYSHLQQKILCQITTRRKTAGVTLNRRQSSVMRALFLGVFRNNGLGTVPPGLLASSHHRVIVHPLTCYPRGSVTHCTHCHRFPVVPYALYNSRSGLRQLRVGRVLRT